MPGSYNVIGLMSGTSLDGVDLAHCTFTEAGEKFTYSVNASETIPYSTEWHHRLKELHSASALEYASTHAEYGRLLGKLVSQFVKGHSLPTDFVASHGHTIFHQPNSGFTSQVGDGAAIAAGCGIAVICDFRTGDVAHGGQGAPLVPIGDELLFNKYDYCLNLGGFANISYHNEGRRIAFDICPANIALNHVAGLTGQSFDKDGLMAASGEIDSDLLAALGRLPYYESSPPKSLGREWLESEFLPLLKSSTPITDQLRTLVEHIAIEVSHCIPDNFGNMLVTGGGALNSFLIERIKDRVPVKIIIPDNVLIEYKEAIIFALLGLLRVLGKPNCLASVTGAAINACGGSIYMP